MKTLYRNRQLWLLIFGGWTLFGFFFAVQSAINNAYFGRPAEFGKTLVSWLSCAYVWAFLTPLVANLADRFPLERKTLWRNSSIHLTIAVSLSFVQLAIYAGVRQQLPGGALTSLTSWQWFQYLLISGFHENLLIYAAIIGLAHAVNYYRRFRERERHAAQLELESAPLETQLAHAHLDALKMQIHPHFLFNTLNSISVLMREDVSAANEMLLRLSDLLRLALKNTDAHEVPLKQELDFLRSYLEIEKTRFQDHLQLKIEADAETLNARVPNLILQPLVENCIRHAVAPKPTASTIEISAARSNGHLKLVVRDDGEGLTEINRSNGAKGIGLANTRARLEKLYGANHEFELAPAIGGGLQATISIPFQIVTETGE